MCNSINETSSWKNELVVTKGDRVWAGTLLAEMVLAFSFN